MANFWIIRSPTSPVEGPFSAAQLKAMARDALITADTMVAGDGTPWVEAGKVKGLTLGAAAEHASAAPVADSNAQDAGTYGLAAETLPPPPSLAAHAHPHAVGPTAGVIAPPAAQFLPSAMSFAAGVPNAHGYIEVGRPRAVMPLLIASCALILLGLVQIGLNIAEVASSPAQHQTFEEWMDDDTLLPSDFVACGVLIFTIALWGFWVAWLHAVHAEVARFTQGRYSVGPGLAVGLCFVPFFNLYWQVHAPYKLAQFIEEHMRTRSPQPLTPFVRPRAYRSGSSSRPTSPSSVLAFQICGLLGGCFIPGASMLLFSLSSHNIQRGLNRMWQDPSNDPIG